MTFEQFRRLISATANAPLERVREDASLRDDLAIDSLQMVNLLVEVSRQCGMELSEISSIEELRTVGSLYRKVEERGSRG